MIPSGTGGRWAIGSAILIHLTTYNESGGATTFFSILFAGVCAIFAGLYERHIVCGTPKINRKLFQPIVNVL